MKILPFSSIYKDFMGPMGQKRLLRSTLFLFFPLLLGGCWAPLSTTLSPGHDTDTLQLALPALEQADNTIPAPFPLDWWQLFHDSQLVELEKEATEGNLDFQLWAARLQESSAALGITASANKPSITGSAGYTRAAISDEDPLAILGIPTRPFNWYEVGFQASWELDLWGHVQHQVEAIQLRLEASGYEMEWARVSVAARVARIYLSLRGVGEIIAILTKDCKAAEELLHLAKSRQKNGIGTRQETASYAADLAAAKSRLPELKKATNSLESNLAMLLGKAPGELNNIQFPSPQPPLPSPPPFGVSSEWARKRPDILAAESRLNATLADVLTAKADFYPRVSLHGGVGLEAMSLSGLGNWDARQFAIGPAVYLPIFTGGRLEKTLTLAEATQQHAAISYQKTVLAAWHEVNKALDGCSSELRRLNKLKQAEARTREVLDGTVWEQQQGVANMAHVLQRRRQLLQTQARIADARTRLNLELVVLYQSLGGGWAEQGRADVALGE